MNISYLKLWLIMQQLNQYLIVDWLPQVLKKSIFCGDFICLDLSPRDGTMGTLVFRWCIALARFKGRVEFYASLDRRVFKVNGFDFLKTINRFLSVVINEWITSIHLIYKWKLGIRGRQVRAIKRPQKVLCY